MNIFLVEDDHEIVNLLTFYLEKENWIVTTSLNLKNALDTINSNFSIFVVDLYLPDGDGLELVKYMKNNFPNTPIIIISAKTSSLDRVIGLELGADDYIVKPFLPQELIYRIKHNKALNQKKRKQSISGYTIDFEKRLIMADQEIIVLSTKEYDLLNFMLTNIGNALSREQLLTHVWDNAEYINDRSIDNQIKNIRKNYPT